MRTQIEWRELRIIGCSQKALDFYSNTDPLAIYKNDDGTYSIAGCFECTAEDGAGLCDVLDSFADAVSECD